MSLFLPTSADIPPNKIFEAVEEATDIGAAIAVPVNCQRVLEYFGYSKDNLKSVNFDGVSAAAGLSIS